MIFKTLNSNQILNIIPFCIFGILLSIIPFLYSLPAPEIQAMPFSKIVFDLVPSNPYLLKGLGLAIIIATCIYTNNFINQFEIIKNSFVPGLIMLAILTSNISYCLLNPMILSLPFITISLKQSFSFDREECNINHLFQSGLYMAIASFFYFPALYLSIFILTAIIYYRTDIFREITISLSGIIIPYIFFFTYLYWNNSIFEFISFIQKNYLSYHITINKQSILFWGICVILLLSLISKSGMTESTIKKRKLKHLFIFLFIISLNTQFLSNVPIDIYPFFIAFPISIFFYSFLSEIQKKWLAELIMYLFLALICYNQLTLI